MSRRNLATVLLALSPFAIGAGIWVGLYLAFGAPVYWAAAALLCALLLIALFDSARIKRRA